jgi:hypothetical protein
MGARGTVKLKLKIISVREYWEQRADRAADQLADRG